MCTLYIIQGFIGAGKTTHSKKISEEKQAVRLNADEYCEEHFSSDQLSSNWDACFAEATAKLWAEAEKILGKGQSVILDFGFWTKSSRDRAKVQAQKLGVKYEHHYLHTSDDVLMERIKMRSGPIAEQNIKNFSEIKKSFEEPAEDEGAITIRT